MYKVKFFPNSEEHTFVFFKWFKTAEEAFQFSELRGEDILEIRKYDNQTNNTQDKSYYTR
jgi:hypothetical protein